VPVDESPDCYKPAEEVLRAVTEAGLARVEVRLRPLASVKGEE
jgi:tRNA-splicing ligase RtcB